MSTPFIEIKDLGFAYDDPDGRADPVLKDIDLVVEKGEFVAVLGHNGSGKSTLAKLLNLLLVPTSGKIYIDGQDITADDFTEDDLYEVRRKVGMVFQNPDNQLVATAVEDDIAFGPENLGIEPKEIRRRVDEAMELLDITDLATYPPNRLSGGQKQRVAIAGTIAMQPECIIFDEATAMLDPQGRRDVMDTIRMLHDQKHLTILHITHNMDEAVLADRVIVIDDGRILLDDTPGKVFSQVETLNKVGLDVPQPTDLLYDLNREGFSFPLDRLSPEDAADVILDYYNQKKR